MRWPRSANALQEMAPLLELLPAREAFADVIVEDV
jgi:hypothetical protein